MDWEDSLLNMCQDTQLICTRIEVKYHTTPPESNTNIISKQLKLWSELPNVEISPNIIEA